MARIHPFEYVGAYKLFTEERFLLADDMGMFKTAQSIFAGNKFHSTNARLRSLVVCPSSVREHWAREITKWGVPNDVNIISASTFQSDIRKAKKSKWNIIHYPLLSALDRSLEDVVSSIGFGHIIMDEVHNSKNPLAIRTRVTKRLVDAADYVSLLSGTPIPNTIADLYTLMSMLDPKAYPLDPNELEKARNSFIQMYFDHPQSVKMLLHKKMLRRKASDYLGKSLPELDIHRVALRMAGRQHEEYTHVLRRNVLASEKLRLLQLISLDPSLAKQGYEGTSEKLKYLDAVVKDEVDAKHGKIIVFTDIKAKIVDKLAMRYSRYAPVVITGDVPLEHSVREGIRQRFQRDPSTKMIIATTTMNEGVDLTAATAVFNLTIPWTPAAFLQRFKRAHRIGEIQQDRVSVYLPYTTIDGPQQSLEQAMLHMMDDKQKTADYLMSGVQVPLEAIRSFDDTHKAQSITNAITSPNKQIFKHFLRWRGIGTESAMRRVSKNPEFSNYIAELYAPSPHQEGFSMARNAAEVYVPLIRALQKSNNLKVKVDLACGPAILAHYLAEPVICIDIDPAMLQTGKKYRPDCTYIRGAMDAIPLHSNYANLMLCSLAWQMVESTEGRCKSLIEASRVLRQGGYFIITLPDKYLNDADRDKLRAAMKATGLQQVKYLSEAGKSSIELIAAQKVRKTRHATHDLTFQGDTKQ